ncbi:MAG TPA: TerC/Alx family metal homeostasis membrane protein [Candidatus Baltobacteraceae bacterium]|jgi:tellurite resistance protein TerC|nr:TerC/Alx family metal homeostasis membrane protein [Candidatus Baltobacteraceae bacterium]
MPAPVPITAWHWAGFILVILLLVALDLGVFHRFARVVKLREALLWTSVWIMLALLFARGLAHWRGQEESLQFLTGYLVEFSLSMDNVFAIAVIFSSFGVSGAHQYRVLYWGIAGALLMRGLMIGVGAALLQTFQWVSLAVGAFLVLTGIQWAFSRQPVVRSGENLLVRLARKAFPISPGFEGDHFLTWIGARRALTPLALVLLAVETTDLLFAVDSIPAIFAVTQNAFIVFTSNIFAILGLRSLYFVLAGAIAYFRYLRTGLAIILVFIGLKMLLARWHSIPTIISLAVVLAILALSIGSSIVAARFGKPAMTKKNGTRD